MKNVALIVQREFASYVKTPAGYVIAAIALLWQALAFNAYAVGDEARLSTDVLTRFLEVSGGTTIVTGVIFSMRLLAEERVQGTQVLLMTAPLREVEIVLGKYVASLAFLSLVTVSSAYLPALIFVHGKVSVGHILAGYLGLLFLAASTLAIGMVASSVSRHPFTSVLLTGGLVAMLEISWWVARTSEGVWAKVLAHASPFYQHFQSFRQGIVQASDVVFFFGLVYFALLCSTHVLRGQRWR